MPWEHIEAGRTLVCQRCGYQLRGSASDRCPECGASFELLRLMLDVDMAVHKKASELESALAAALGGAVAFPLLFRLCPPFGLLAIAPLVYATFMLVSGIRWRIIHRNRHALASASSSARHRYVRAFKGAALAYPSALALGALLVYLIIRYK